MALRAIKGTNIPTRDVGAQSAQAPSGLHKAPTIILAMDNAQVIVGDSIGSTIDMVDAPSDCMIGPGMMHAYIPNMGAGVTLNFGDSVYPSGLLAGQAASAVTAVDVFVVGKTNDDIGKPLWQLLGYSSDPKTALRLRATVAGAAIANASTLGYRINCTKA